MGRFNERYVVDGSGKPVAVLIDMDDYRCILSEIQALDALRAAGAVASRDDPGRLDSPTPGAEIRHHSRSPDAGPERLREVAGLISLARVVSLDEFHEWEIDEQEQAARGVDDAGG